LGGRTIAELQAQMTDKEFQAWIEFYRHFPFDDFHRFHRPAALIASRGGTSDALQSALAWLQPEPVDPALANYSAADLNTLRAFGIKPGAKPEG
jgi:hypothetical protein